MGTEHNNVQKIADLSLKKLEDKYGKERAKKMIGGTEFMKANIEAARELRIKTDFT